MNVDKKLQEEFGKIHDKLKPNIKDKGLIYHYTNFYGLSSILRERKLRYTDYRYFNDPTELEYGKSIIIGALLDSGKIELAHIKRLIELFNCLDKKWYCYIACFADKIDELALWRYYASNGTGFAIGFNENFHKIEQGTARGKPVIYDVLYGNKCNETVELFLDKYLEYAKNTPKDSKDDLFGQLVLNLISILPSLKDNSFEDEHEVRMCRNEGEIMQDKTGKPFFFDDDVRGFTPIKESNTPFVKSIKGNKSFVTPDKFLDSDISEIWVGPSCEFLEARQCIRKLLQDAGYDVREIDIKPCGLPLKDS